MKVTRAPSSAPIRSASPSSSGSGASAGIAPEQIRRQPRLGDQRVLDPLIDLLAHRGREQQARDRERDDRGARAPRRRIWSGTSCAAPRRHRCHRRRIDELVAELLHGDQAVGERGQFLAQAPDVDVDGARAAGIAVAPDVGQEHVARQHPAAMPQQILEQQELLRGERDARPSAVTGCRPLSSEIVP